MLSMSYRISAFCLEHELKQSTSPNWFFIFNNSPCVCVYLPTFHCSQPILETKNATLSCWVSPTKCAASVSAKAFLSCCELSRAKRNLHRRGGYQGTRGVWKNPIKISGETKTSPYKNKNMRNYVENTYFARNVPHESWICFYVFLFQTIIDSPPKKNSKKTTRTKTPLNPWPPGHERCEEQESHFHGPIFGCLGPSTVVAQGLAKARRYQEIVKGILPKKTKHSKKNWWSASRKLITRNRIEIVTSFEKYTTSPRKITVTITAFIGPASFLTTSQPVKLYHISSPRPHTKRVPQVTPRSPMWFKVRSVVGTPRWRAKDYPPKNWHITGAKENHLQKFRGMVICDPSWRVL